MTYLSQAAAAVAVDPKSPPHRDTLNVWHDKVRGPRDSNGRRIFTSEVCAQIRAARADAQKAARA